MSLNLEAINQQRHALSALASTCLVAGVFSMAQSIKGPAELVAQEVMELTTTLIEPLIQKPAPQPPEIRPEPKPKSVVPTPVAVPTPRQDIKQEVTPPIETARSIPAPPQTMAAVAPVAQVVTEPPKQVMQQAAPALNLENNYIASVRNTLNANKRYPTGREASLQRPSGKVKIGFVLLRNGSLVEASVEESSNSIILDNAALTTVRRTTYSPWPDGSWPSQSQHKFTVSLDFMPLN
jgi:protein TonB